MAKQVSWPHEHGALVTLCAGAILAVTQAPRPLAAAGVALLLVGAFFAREPLVRGAPRDPWLLATCALTAAVGVSLVVQPAPLAGVIAVGVAGAILAGFVLARRARQHRTAWFEVLGMACLGASTGLAAVAGGVALRPAALLALVLAVHAGVAVPLVRTELRRRERTGASRATLVGLAVVAASAVLVILAGAPALALAATPRAAQLGYRLWRLPAPARPAIVGVRETLLLAVAALIAALTLPPA